MKYIIVKIICGNKYYYNYFKKKWEGLIDNASTIYPIQNADFVIKRDALKDVDVEILK